MGAPPCRSRSPRAPSACAFRPARSAAVPPRADGGACYPPVMSSLDLQPCPSPLRLDAAGVVRVGATRVTLESVLHAYLRGASPQVIVRRFPTLELADVHTLVRTWLDVMHHVGGRTS